MRRLVLIALAKVTYVAAPTGGRFVSFVLIVVGPCLVAHFARSDRKQR